MADTTADPHLGRVVAGYRIEERIGRGGMGLVYRAEHLNLRRRAAIKIIAPELAERAGLPRALQPRGADRRRAPAPEHRDGLRRGRGGRPALPRDAVHRGLRPLDRAAQPGPAAPVPRARRLPPGRRRARRRALAGPDPPRRQARQRADRGPHGVPDRLRPDQADRGVADAADEGGRRGRDDPLRRAGADRGRPRRRAHRHLLARLPRLPLPLGRAAVRARHRRGGHLRAPVGGAAAADLRAPRAAGRDGRRDREGAREGARAPLPDLRGHDERRALGDRRGRAARRHRDAAAGARVRRPLRRPDVHRLSAACRRWATTRRCRPASGRSPATSTPRGARACCWPGST